jgi:lantibiotic modifying enzyme
MGFAGHAVLVHPILGIARAALRWVANSALPGAGGLAWPEIPGKAPTDDVYAGTAGVLLAFSEARLSGIDEFDAIASRAAGRLQHLAANPAPLDVTAESGQPGDSALYTGQSGYCFALRCWAQASGDQDSAEAAGQVAAHLASHNRNSGADAPYSTYRDLLLGEAGVLLCLIAEEGEDGHAAASVIADRLVVSARAQRAGVDWFTRDDLGYYMPNFSHGCAGISYALARASSGLQRPDLLDVAVAGANRLLDLGAQPDGSFLAPSSVPTRNPEFPVSYGWCHGPTGTLRLFSLLDQLLPGAGWDVYERCCRQAVRSSGLPARIRPGFWDNIGQCCGTAGVGEMALDAFQETADSQWLDWADALAHDVVARAISDDGGTRWSNTEHRVSPPNLPPGCGWMQGTAGIAGWLCRLARIHDSGIVAPRLEHPDRPPLRYVPASARVLSIEGGLITSGERTMASGP